MCRSPKVDDGVDIKKKVLEHLFSDFFVEKLQTAITPKPLELLN